MRKISIAMMSTAIIENKLSKDHSFHVRLMTKVGLFTEQGNGTSGSARQQDAIKTEQAAQPAISETHTSD
jgi:hypothetical protein